MIYNLKLFHEAELIMSELCTSEHMLVTGTSEHVLVTGTMELFEVFVMISDLDGIYGF
jgi:hypothetical protein